MEDIKAIIKLLSKQKIKQIEILSEKAKLSEKSMALYNGIKQGDITNDDEASALLYNDDRNNPIYRVLKHRFKERLINTLFFIDVQAYGKSTYQKVLNRSYKNWAASKLLLDKGLRQTGINILETTLISSLKYDIEELSIMIVKDLKMHYGLFEYNVKKFNKYKSKGVELNQIYNLKLEIEEYYCILGHLIETKKSVKYTDQIVQIEKDVIKIHEAGSTIDSYYLRFYIFMCLYMIQFIKKDFEKQIQITSEALTYFETKVGFKKIGTVAFLQIRGIAEMSSGNYDTALNSFHKCLNFKSKVGGILWQSLHNYIFIIHILKKNYTDAYQILSHVISHKAFNYKYSDIGQHWFLKEAFMQFLIRVKKVDSQIVKAQKIRPFRLARLLNETPALSKDKRGYNVSIHIIQMLFLIIDEKYDRLIDKLDSLKQYSFRYLRSEEYTRARTFIKMLLMIPKYDYHTKTILTKTKNLHQKLMDTPMDFSEQAMSIEIIPYEQLWEEVMGLLELI